MHSRPPAPDPLPPPKINVMTHVYTKGEMGECCRFQNLNIDMYECEEFLKKNTAKSLAFHWHPLLGPTNNVPEEQICIKADIHISW